MIGPSIKINMRKVRVMVTEIFYIIKQVYLPERIHIHILCENYHFLYDKFSVLSRVKEVIIAIVDYI